MMSNRYLVPRVILAIMAVYHVVVGVALNCPPEWVKWVAEQWFGISRLPDASSIHIARMLGVYMAAFGIALGTAAWNPVKNRSILTIGILLAAVRCVQRLATAGDLQASLGIPPASNIALIGPLALFTVVLIYFRWRIYLQMKGGGSNLAR